MAEQAERIAAYYEQEPEWSERVKFQGDDIGEF